ncbi:MAG TPA: pyridoxamine 5'-phosphate oxidase family protein [Oceanobacillus sp.]|nr:pyridoxamine 5'-phosphate oxidase family protein [Oceanobacillus sp.]
MSTLKTYDTLPALVIPTPSRPAMPKDYGVPESSKGMLTWDWVSERMTNALVYWIGTLHSANRPHLMPNWGAWVDNYFMFGTHPATLKARNLARDPHISIGVQDGQHGVVIEGVVGQTTNKDLLARMDDEYERKYKMREEAPAAYVVIPHKVIALGDFPNTPTRWIFEGA